MQHIRVNPVVAIAGEWFTAHGRGINPGYFGKRLIITLFTFKPIASIKANFIFFVPGAYVKQIARFVSRFIIIRPGIRSQIPGLRFILCCLFRFLYCTLFCKPSVTSTCFDWYPKGLPCIMVSVTVLPASQ